MRSEPLVVDPGGVRSNDLQMRSPTPAQQEYEWEIDMADDGHPDDLVGAYAIGACSFDEARSVAEHASGCPACAGKIVELSRVAEWIGVATATMPAPELRSRVLSAALAVRPAGRPAVDLVSVANNAARDAGQAPRLGQAGDDGDPAEVHRLLEQYRVQVDELDQLLSGLSQPQWLLPTGPHRSVHDMMVHLCGNDGRVAAAAGEDLLAPGDLSSTSDVRLGWRGQAHAIMEVAARQGPQLLRQEVRLAGRTAVRRPMREALVQRGFETWIHAEDIRATLRLPPRKPSAQQVSDIVSFALRLVPAAMDAAGRAHPHQAVRLVLTGVGGGTRLVGLAASPAPGSVVAELSLPAERFCRMIAGRLAASSANVEINGDSGAAADFLTVVATMGCD
jgi:uncharacterized protein (TIGR03083 family)